MNEEAEKGIAGPSTEDKLKIRAQLAECTLFLMRVFGAEETAKMLRAEARLVFPRAKAVK